MAIVELTPLIESKINRYFAPELRVEVRNLLLNECGQNLLPTLENADAKELEHFRLAALKVSGGDMEQLRRAIIMVNNDYRDLLLEAMYSREAELEWNSPDASAEEYDAACEADRQEYLAWLNEGED